MKKLIIKTKLTSKEVKKLENQLDSIIYVNEDLEVENPNGVEFTPIIILKTHKKPMVFIHCSIFENSSQKNWNSDNVLSLDESSECVYYSSKYNRSFTNQSLLKCDDTIYHINNYKNISKINFGLFGYFKVDDTSNIEHLIHLNELVEEMED